MLSSEGRRLQANHKHRVSVAMTTATLAGTQYLSDSLSVIQLNTFSETKAKEMKF